MSSESDVKRILGVLERAPQVYEPREDTFLMLTVLEKTKLQGKSVLEVGTGSGVVSLFCALHGANVVASDISEAALKATRTAARRLGVRVETVQSSLLAAFLGKPDLILFNPPYLVSGQSMRDKTVDGGPDGNSAIRPFLSELPGFLAASGCCLLVLSSINNPNQLIQQHRDLSFENVASRSLFFEELFVFRVSKS